MITAAAGMWAGATIWIAWHSRRVFLGLPELIACRASYREDVTAVIPARNEAGKIGRAVRSLASQARVIVVDDHSTDATAAEAKAAGALVIPAPPLATCALGKPSACLAGAHAAKSRWILFVDADTWYEPNFVASLIDHAERHALDSASVFLRNDCQSWVERLLLPYAFGLYFCGVDVRRDPIANGQCLLFQTKAYWSIGGHQPVLGSVIEDMAIAQNAARAGLRQEPLRTGSLGAVRMYDSFRAIWRGFQKNSFRFLAAQPRTGARVILASTLFTSYAPLLAWMAGASEPALAVAVGLVPAVAFWNWYGTWAERLQAPFAIYLFQLIALDGMRVALGRGRSEWKGRYV